MDYIRLGRTELKASVMGLGCGGHSRLGQATGNTEQQSIAVVKRALDLGINFIDTAEGYRTEPIVGKALTATQREQVILSTKKSLREDDHLITGTQLKEGLERSLANLKTDYVDVYHLHGLQTEDYDYACSELVPALTQLQEQGKIRFTGVTEVFGRDPQHAMLTRAVKDNYWDVIMVGFNVLNQSARDRVLPWTRANDIGVLIMFAVRRALRSAENLREMIADLHNQGLIDPDKYSTADIKALLGPAGGAESMQDAAYRFCRYEPGVHVTLSGTGSIEHLEANYNSLLRPPLPADTTHALQTIFADIDSVSGN